MSGADDDLSRARAELGEPEGLFQVSPGWFRTKLLLAVGLILTGVAAGVGLWWFGLLGGAAVFAKLLLAPLIAGIALLWHLYRNRGLFVLVYPTGLLRLRRGEVDSFPWPEIEQVRLRVKRAEGPELTRDAEGRPAACWIPVDAPTIQLWAAGVALVRADGQEASFGPALADFPALAEEVQRRTFANLWPRFWDRFRAGEVVPFGALELSPAGIRHEKKLLAWRDLKELTIAQGRLTIKQDGRWLPWALLQVPTIPNPHVLFALVGEARRLRSALKKQPHPAEADHDDDRPHKRRPGDESL
jgi:hypothetical protein